MGEHLTDWLAGKPLQYRTIALLVGARIEATLEIEPGIRVEKLPANTRDLPQSVPGLGSVAPATYLGGVVLCVDCEVVPALYRPEKGMGGSWNFSDDVRHSWGLGAASVDEFCETLSLSANGCIRSRQVWRDYGELEAFSALTSRTTDPLKAIHGGVAVESLTEEHLREAWDIGDDGVHVDVGGHAVERAAERHQRAGVVRDVGVLGVVENGPRVGQLAADLEERRELDRRGLAHSAPEQRPLDLRVEPVAVLEDVAGKLPAPRAREGVLLRLADRIDAAAPARTR